MARPASKLPTELELEILKILWQKSPASVRQVRDALVPFRDLAHTSVMTIMTIMTDKGYLQRSKDGGSFVYRPKVKQQSTLRSMLDDLVTRAFDGSTSALLLNLIATTNLDADELRKLRTLINEKTQESKQ